MQAHIEPQLPDMVIDILCVVFMAIENTANSKNDHCDQGNWCRASLRGEWETALTRIFYAIYLIIQFDSILPIYSASLSALSNAKHNQKGAVQGVADDMGKW